MPSRREFIARSAAAGAALLVAPRSSRAADCRIDIRLDEPIATIAPEIYGHFAEHLGGVVYDGIWVGEGSKIPNVGGIRKALVDKLKPLQAPVVIRWPGGCFADSYDWRDGIGAAALAPRRTNFWLNTKVDARREAAAAHGPQDFDPNRFGPDEFVRFCRLPAPRPTWPPTCAARRRAISTSGSSSATRRPARRRWRRCARRRASATRSTCATGVSATSPGAAAADFSPEDYATEFRRFTSWVPDYDVGLRFIGARP